MNIFAAAGREVLSCMPGTTECYEALEVDIVGDIDSLWQINEWVLMVCYLS